MTDHSIHAFPVPPYSGERGMTLRQWLAGKAMHGTLANGPLFEALATECGSDPLKVANELAIHCYRIADQMILAGGGL